MSADEERRAKASAKQRRYRERHPERVKASYNAWRIANPEKARAATASWAERNKEQRSAKARDDWADPETRKKKQEWHRDWSRRNADKLSKKAMAWAKANPEKYLATQQRAKARKRGAAVSDFTHQHWTELLTEHASSCFYCGTTGVPLQREHKVPLSRGGLHTKSNIVPACAPCNMRKATKTADEFLACP